MVWKHVLWASGALGACKPTTQKAPDALVKGFQQKFNNAYYFEECAKAMGIPLPAFPKMECSDLVDIPRYAPTAAGDLHGAGQWASPCFNPDSNFGNTGQTCNTAPVSVGTYFMVNGAGMPVAFTLACTNGFRQVIVHRYDTGDTCFFSGGQSFSNPREVAQWIQNLHQPVMDQSCVSCHAQGPFVRSAVVLTETLEAFLGKDMYRKALVAKSPDHPQTKVFLEGPPDPGALKQAMGGQPYLLVHGVPQNIFKRPGGKGYGSLRYRIVAKGLLERSTSVAAWNPQPAAHPGVAGCTGCHQVMATPLGASMAAHWVGACGAETKGSTLCRGFHREGFEKVGQGATPHQAFTSVPVKATTAQKEALLNFALECQRGSRSRCTTLGTATPVAPPQGEALFFDRLRVAVQYQCPYTDSALSWVAVGKGKVFQSEAQWVPFQTLTHIEADKTCAALLAKAFPKKSWMPTLTTVVHTGAQLVVSPNHCLEAATDDDYGALQKVGLPPLSPTPAFPPRCPGVSGPTGS